MDIDNCITPNEKLLFLIFYFRNKGFKDLHHVAKIMKCPLKTAGRYMIKARDIAPFFPELTVTFHGGRPGAGGEVSRIRIEDIGCVT
jgi:hypothetical protein